MKRVKLFEDFTNETSHLTKKSRAGLSKKETLKVAQKFADALAQLRDLRSGDEYDAYVNNLQGLAKIVAMKQGQSLVRIQGENGTYSEQMWSFFVENLIALDAL